MRKIILIVLGVLILLFIYCCCRVASMADEWMEEHPLPKKEEEEP